MCGIWAQYSKFSTPQLNANIQAIQRRGPDENRIVHHNINVKSLFYHSRLEIIGASLPQSKQPMQNEYATLVYNGEIYNYKQVDPKSKSDTYVLFRLLNILFKQFQTHATKIHRVQKIQSLLQKLDGVFSFCFMFKDSVLFARDCFGVKPLYYEISPNSWTVSSLPHCITSDSPIKELLPGTFVLIEDNIITHEIYRKFPILVPFDDYLESASLSSPSRISEKNTKSNTLTQNFPKNLEKTNPYHVFYQLLSNSIQKRLMADPSVKEIVIYLSGGIDSTIIAAIACLHAPKYKKTIRLYTLYFSEASQDFQFAQQIADILKVEWIPIKMNITKKLLEETISVLATDDIPIVRAGVAYQYLSQQVKIHKNTKIVLVGEGADELFAGYQHFSRLKNLKEIQLESNRMIETLFCSELLRVDRTTADNGLEARVPFLDLELVEYVLNLDPKIRFETKNGLNKMFLRTSFFKYHPMKFPDKIIFRPKMQCADGVGLGFIDSMQKYDYSSIFQNQFQKTHQKQIYKLKTWVSEYRRRLRSKLTKTTFIDVNAHSIKLRTHKDDLIK